MKKLFIGFLSLLNLHASAQVSLETFVEDNSFILFDKPLSSYTGTYINGKCYSGYFKTEYKEYEMILVDYYENGALKYQYSKSFVAAENFYDEKNRLDVKSTYKHDKIFNGIEYAFINKGLTCKKITNGHIESFAVHVFAMHYYNRIDFSKQDSIITVTNLLEKECEIRYQFTHAGFVSEFNSPEFSICKSDYRNIKMTDLPKSSFIYYIKSEK